MDIVKGLYNFTLLKNSIYFKIAFMIWALIYALGYGGYITGYFSTLFIIWGLLLVFKNLVLKEVLIKKQYIYILLAFLLGYVITIIYNKDFNIVGNIKSLIWAAIMFFAIFLNEKSNDKEKIYKDIIKISNVLVISVFIVSLISVLMFCFDVSYEITRVDGKVIPQGFHAARLWGVYIDPNEGSTIAISALIASIILLIFNKYSNKLYKGFNIINIFIQYIFIILTGSRGGEIAFIAVITGLVYLAIDFILKSKLKKIYIRRLVAILIGFIVSIMIIGSFDDTRQILGNIPRLTLKTQHMISKGSGGAIGQHKGNVTMVRPDVGENKEVSNGRLTLWSDGFKLIKYSPILGFGDRNIFIKAKELTPGSSLESQYVHNGFIHMLLSGGIVSVIIMFILLLLVAIKVLKIVFSKDLYTSKYYVYSCMSLIVVTTLIATVFLTEIFYKNSIIATIFWLYMGFIVSIDKKDLTEEK